MSLFPAYSQERSQEQPTSSLWQENSSYRPPENSGDNKIRECEIVHNDDVHVKQNKAHNDDVKFKRKKSHKDKIKKYKTQQSVKLDKFKEEDDFYEDKIRRLENLSVKTLSRPAVPKYFAFRNNMLSTSARQNVAKRKERYFRQKIIIDLDTNECTAVEEERVSLLSKTEEFNKLLTKNPYDINLWMTFIDFQDDLMNFEFSEQHRNKTSLKRSFAEKKLSIIERAIKNNPNNDTLIKKWLEISRQILPVHEVCENINDMLKQSPRNCMLWLGLISVNQCSLSLSTVPKILDIFERALENFHSARVHTSETEAIRVGKCMLELYLHLGTFLSQTGLLEKLCCILTSYLGINLDIKNQKLNTNADIEMRGLEDHILQSGLPLPQLWYRIEKLRQGAYFYPTDDMDCVDPQRIVMPEDVAQLVYHINPRLNFDLSALTLTLLKVPPPNMCTSMVKYLLLDRWPWTTDSVEFVFSNISLSPIFKLDLNYLKVLSIYTSGAQYIIPAPGQESYLNYISNIFGSLCKKFTDVQRVALCIWMLRFERWLSLLEHHKLMKLPKNRKPGKAIFKEFLKQTENRDNILYYKEFSLYEYDRGNTDASIKILESTISSKPAVDFSIQVVERHRDLISVCRTLCEVYISLDKLESAKGFLLKFFRSISASDVKDTIEKLINFDDRDISGEELILPSVTVELIGCFAWYLTLSESYSSAVSYIEQISSKLSTSESTHFFHLREQVCEIKALILFKMVDGITLKQNLEQMLTLFPYNSVFITSLVHFEQKHPSLWWTFVRMFSKYDNPAIHVIWICLALDRYEKCVEEFKPSLVNKINTCFEKLGNDNKCQSSLVYRLGLKFAEKNSGRDIDGVFMKMLETFPWYKCVYIDGASALPTKLNHITDLLVEKEMRIHITPDELEVLRC